MQCFVLSFFFESCALGISCSCLLFLASWCFHYIITTCTKPLPCGGSEWDAREWKSLLLTFSPPRADPFSNTFKKTRRKKCNNFLVSSRIHDQDVVANPRRRRRPSFLRWNICNIFFIDGGRNFIIITMTGAASLQYVWLSPWRFLPTPPPQNSPRSIFTIFSSEFYSKGFFSSLSYRVFKKSSPNGKVRWKLFFFQC